MSTIEQAKGLIAERKFKECEALICTAMFEHPHDPIPHNLMGLMLESEHRHLEAMKHFRAALRLTLHTDPHRGIWNVSAALPCRILVRFLQTTV